MKTLKVMQFGEPILRRTSRKLTQREINSNKIQHLIADMRHALISQKLGIGLAAPQVGENISLAVIAIRPTKHRPKVNPFDLIIMNPVITWHSPRRRVVWEGCISSGPRKTGLFAKTPRYPKVKVSFYDEKAQRREEIFSELKAQVIQHEIDHLNGVLFVDHVKDTKSYMTYDEYFHRVVNNDE